MFSIADKLTNVKAKIADAQMHNNQKRVDALERVLRELHMEKHKDAQSKSKPKQPLGKTSALVDIDQISSDAFFATWGSHLTNSEFCLSCKTASAQQKGTKQEREAAFSSFCSTIGIELSAHCGETDENHKARTRPFINLAEAIMRLGELLYRLNEFLLRQTSGMPIDAGHQKKVEDVMVFLLKGKYAQIAWDMVSRFPAILPFFIEMANTIADKNAAEATVRAQKKQAKAAPKTGVFGGSGCVASLEQVQTFQSDGAAVAHGGGAVVAHGGGAVVARDGGDVVARGGGAVVARGSVNAAKVKPFHVLRLPAGAPTTPKNEDGKFANGAVIYLLGPKGCQLAYFRTEKDMTNAMPTLPGAVCIFGEELTAARLLNKESYDRMLAKRLAQAAGVAVSAPASSKREGEGKSNSSKRVKDDSENDSTSEYD